MGFFDLFAAPKQVPFVVIRNRVGEEIDRFEAWDLCGKNLKHRQWMHAELSGLSLAGADCDGINLFGARLVKTSFCRTNLRGAEISFADASGADFRKSELEGCLMYRSETKNARFDDALIDESSDIPGRKVLGTLVVR